MGPEQDGQLSGRPLRSLEIKWSAWAGLYVFGRGFLMLLPMMSRGSLVRGLPYYKVTI